MAHLSANDRLIVALDFDTKEEAMGMVGKLGDDVNFYKVGWQLFLRTHFEVIKELQRRGKKVFLDLKITDIGATIEKALKHLPEVEIIELMTLSGGANLVSSARKAAPQHSDTMFLMLTVLSSMDDEDIKALYGDSVTLEKVISYTAKKAIETGCDGVIASGESIRQIRASSPEDFIIVAPGIRPKGYPTDDHKRSLTPYEAIAYGANYLVVGRSITQQSDDPSRTAKEIIGEIEKALRDKSSKKSESKDDVPHEPLISSNMAHAI